MKKYKIAHLSDIHFSRIFPRTLFYKIYCNLNKIKPDYICITGDLIDQSSVIEKKNYQNELRYWLQKYSEVAPVIIGLGNHDVSCFKQRSSKEVYHKEFFQNLNNIKGIHFLDNEEYIPNKDISFYGVTIPFSHYKENERNPLKINSTKWSGMGYRVLLMHSPQHCLQNSILEENELLRDSDTILAGHMHRGLVPIVLNKFLPTNLGIISPQKTLFPKYARGVVKKQFDKKTITLVISGGVIKFSETAPKLFHAINRFFAPEITIVEVDEKKFVKAKDIMLK